MWLPQVCSCCLAPTERTSSVAAQETVRVGVRRVYRAQIPKCASCAWVTLMHALLMLGAIALGFLIGYLVVYSGHVKKPHEDDFPLVMKTVGIAAGVGFAAWLVMRVVPPFKRPGHQFKCVSHVIKSGGELEWKNPEFARMAQEHKVAMAADYLRRGDGR